MLPTPTTDDSAGSEGQAHVDDVAVCSTRSTPILAMIVVHISNTVSGV